MAGYYVANKDELIKQLVLLIKKGETVGCGDSVTLEPVQNLFLVVK